IHVAQLLLLAVLALRLMPVRARAELAAAVLAALVLFGMHTFDGLVREAFPINSFLTIVLCVLAVIVLADGQPAGWRDVTAATIAASVVAPGLVLGAIPGAVGRWRAGSAGGHDRLLFVAVTVLLANAVISFAYTKDVIMSAGGTCFALGVYAAAALLLSRRP